MFWYSFNMEFDSVTPRPGKRENGKTEMQTQEERERHKEGWGSSMGGVMRWRRAGWPGKERSPANTPGLAAVFKEDNPSIQWPRRK